MPKLRFEFPLPRPHTGVALGNGCFGVLAWGGERLALTINRSDFWDHRHEQHLLPGMSYDALRQAHAAGDQPRAAAVMGERMTCWPPGPTRQRAETFVPGPLRPKMLPGDFMASRLPMGRWEFGLRAGYALARGTLDAGTGELGVSVRSARGRPAGRLRLAMHPDRPVVWIADPRRLLRNARGRSAWEWVAGWLRARQLPRPRAVPGAGERGWVQACPADDAMATVCQRAPGGWWLTMERGPTGAAALASARRTLAACRRAGGPALAAAAARHWRGFWRRAPRLRLPDRACQEIWDYALFRFGGAASPRGGVPSSLQGPWIEDYQPPPWCGDYHFNVNIQQIYSPAFGAGQMDHVLPLFDMLDGWRKVMRHNAKVLLGIDDGLVMGMLTTDRGHLIYYGAGCVLDLLVSAWTAQLYWLYYRYTGDTAFLRERAYPFMVGIMRGFEAMLEPRAGPPEPAPEEFAGVARRERRAVAGDPWPGRGPLTLPLAVSPEYADARGNRLGRDPSCQLAAIHWLADALLRASRILGRPPRPAWRAIRRRLPLFRTVGEGRQRRLAVWEGQDLDVCHRHHSHLAAVYPFDILGRLTPVQQQILDNSLDHWIALGMGQWSEWCMPWAAILQARTGMPEAPVPLLRLWQALFVNEGRATVYLPRFRGLTAHRRADLAKPLETHEVMQLDGAMGAATAVMEMVAHERGGAIHVGAGLPAAWRDLSVRRLRLPGPLLLGLDRRDGALRRLTLRHLVGGPVRLVAHGAGPLREAGPGGRPVTFPLVRRLRAGETLTLVPTA